jgi:hypothetical protein
LFLLTKKAFPWPQCETCGPGKPVRKSASP